MRLHLFLISLFASTILRHHCPTEPELLNRVASVLQLPFLHHTRNSELKAWISFLDNGEPPNLQTKQPALFWNDSCFLNSQGQKACNGKDLKATEAWLIKKVTALSVVTPPVIILGRLRQKDCHKFQGRLNYMVSHRMRPCFHESIN